MTTVDDLQIVENAQRTVAVVGASTQRRKYGNRAVRAHTDQGWTVFPIHPTAEQIEGWPAFASLGELPVAQVERVTMYLPPAIGVTLLEAIARKRPREVWLNPGSADEQLLAKAEELRLPIIQACSIVDIGRSPAMYDTDADAD